MLGKLKPGRSESRNTTSPDVCFETSPPPTTPTAPRAINRAKSHALQILARNTPSSNKLKVPIDQLGRAAEGAAAEKNLSAGMLKDMRSKAKDLSPVANCRQLSKARVIDVVHFTDKREREDSKEAAMEAARKEKKKLRTPKNLVAGTKGEGN